MLACKSLVTALILQQKTGLWMEAKAPKQHCANRKHLQGLFSRRVAPGVSQLTLQVVSSLLCSLCASVAVKNGHEVCLGSGSLHGTGQQVPVLHPIRASGAGCGKNSHRHLQNNHHIGSTKANSVLTKRLLTANLYEFHFSKGSLGEGSFIEVMYWQQNLYLPCCRDSQIHPRDTAILTHDVAIMVLFTAMLYKVTHTKTS